MKIESVDQIEKNVVYRLECDGSLLVDTEIGIRGGTKISDPLMKNLLIGSSVSELVKINFIQNFLDSLTELTKKYGLILNPTGFGSDIWLEAFNPNKGDIAFLSYIEWENGKYVATVDLKAVIE